LLAVDALNFIALAVHLSMGFKSENISFVRVVVLQRYCIIGRCSLA
jgi:hypothetical protein